MSAADALMDALTDSPEGLRWEFRLYRDGASVGDVPMGPGHAFESLRKWRELDTEIGVTCEYRIERRPVGEWEAVPEEDLAGEACTCPVGDDVCDAGALGWDVPAEDTCQVCAALPEGQPCPHEPDLSDCPYYRQDGSVGAHGPNTCMGGCYSEPACKTDRPEDGWPSERAITSPGGDVDGG